MINAAISDIPPDMTIAMHLCRGNFQSTFVASGGYEPVAEILFNTINVHGYFMEYDSDRAGGFEPLRFVPKGKTVVLGLVTSKIGPAGIEGRAQAPHRRGGEIRAARSALPVAAMRLRLHRGRQYPGRGRAMGEAADDRGSGGRSVGDSFASLARLRAQGGAQRCAAEPGRGAPSSLMIPTTAASLRSRSPCPLPGRREGNGAMTNATHQPPFRADHVGSLLRPAALKQAREQRAKGEIDAAALKAVEDREIERVIKKQEEVGLQSITDGEFRRSWWHLDFLWGLDGVEKHVMDTGVAFAAVTTRNEGVKVTGKLGSAQPSDDRAFQVRRRAHQAHAEDHHSGAVGALRPADAHADRRDDLSAHRRLLRRSRPGLQKGRARLSPMPAAAICSSTRCSSPCCATRNIASR